MVDAILEGNCFMWKDEKFLSQSECTRLSYVNFSNPLKVCFLKNLSWFAKFLRLEAVEDVLLVDDSPQKNFLNDVYSSVLPPT